MNAVQRIQAFNAGRDPERRQLKYRAMRASPFAFMRGTCHLFYDQLQPQGLFKAAPLTWLCGDLHLENFGSYKGDNGQVYFDINDFDEAALAPASWDLLRLLTSVQVAADSLGIDCSDANQLGTQLLTAYADALAQGKAYCVERDTAQGLVQALLTDLRERRRPQFLDSRTRLKGKKRQLSTDGKKALPASEAQRKLVTNFMERFARTQDEPDFFEVLDVARRIAGTGSLGLERYVILVRGKGSPDGNYLLDLKAAQPSALAPHLQAVQPAWETPAHRIVALQRRLQSVTVAFLHPVLLDKAPYVLRSLQPSEDRVTLGHSGQTPLELVQLLQTMGQLAAWAQLRSAGRQGSAIADELIDFGADKRWTKHLLLASRECAQQVRADSLAFNAAFDEGAFHP